MEKLNAEVMRISFTGEHSYEINIQANYGKSIMGTMYVRLEKNLI